MAANPLVPFIDSAGVVVLDGGLATELERRGADLNDALWSARVLLENPDLIRDVHEAYFRAGADVAVTASYQASVEGFLGWGLDAAGARAMIRRSVTLAEEAREQFWSSAPISPGRLRPLIAGSIGPYGAALADGSEYRGNYRITLEELADFHRPRMEVLATSDVDLLAIETIPSPIEAVILVEMLLQWPDRSAWVSFSCRDDAHLGEGQPVEQAAALIAASPQVLAIGVNCVAPAHVEGLLRRLRTVTDKPLVAYPNSGERWDPEQRCWVGEGTAATPLRDAPRWHALGARLIGGCCRTTPDMIQALRATLEATIHASPLQS